MSAAVHSERMIAALMPYLDAVPRTAREIFDRFGIGAPGTTRLLLAIAAKTGRARSVIVPCKSGIQRRVYWVDRP